MARGDFFVFNQFVEDVGLGLHDLNADTFNVGIVNNNTVPSKSTADPRWGAGGTTDFSVNEVSTAGTEYTGPIAVGNTYSQTGGTGLLDFTTDISLSQDASGPTDCHWGIVYNSTDAGLRAVGFVDLGGPISLQDGGPITINWNTNGVWELGRAA